MIARMVFQMTMMAVALTLAVHMVVQRNHAQAPQVATAVTIAQPAPQVQSMMAVRTQPAAAVTATAAVVAQVKPATKVGAKDDVAPGKPAVLDHNAPGTLEVASLPETGEVVR